MQNAAKLLPLPLIAGGSKKRMLWRRLSRIATDGARPHPYAVADFTALALIWNHIFLKVSNFFAKGSRFGSAIFGISLVFPGSITTMVTVTQA